MFHVSARSVSSSFGPIGETGGDARLLDALGASRHRLEVVACFRAADLDPERLRGPGPRLLADLLAFAERRGQGATADALARPAGAAVGATGDPAGEHAASDDAAPDDSPAPDRLVVDLAERLWRHGLVVEIDYGLPGGTRIPLAVGHPDLPGRLLVAVLTDDDAYVAEPSIRVRDRQVADRLERLGWSVVLVWSAAAFLDPQAEVDRIRRAVHACVLATPQPPSAMLAPTVGDDDDDAEVDGVGTDVIDSVPQATNGVLPHVRLEAPPAMAGGAVNVEQPTLAVPTCPRPHVRSGLPVSAYSDDELDDIVAWIASDGSARSREELAARVREELGITRRGARVDVVVAAAVRRATR